MDKIYKVALVGCGTIAPNHLRALKSIPYVKIVALCDLNFEKAESRKSEYELDCNVYTDFDVMLDSEELAKSQSSSVFPNPYLETSYKIIAAA